MPRREREREADGKLAAPASQCECSIWRQIMLVLPSAPRSRSRTVFDIIYGAVIGTAAAAAIRRSATVCARMCEHDVVQKCDSVECGPLTREQVFSNNQFRCRFDVSTA